MNARVFLDTNVLVYAVGDAADPRSERARLCLEAGGLVSVQVLNEFASVARRKLRRPWPEIRAALSAFADLGLDVRPLTLEVHYAALDLAEQDGLELSDACIVATARAAGCRVLWSEDLQDGRRFGDLLVRNPFSGASGLPSAPS